MQFKGISASGKILFFLLLVYAATSVNPFLTLAAIVVPFILYSLLWKKEESPFLFMAALLQWLSITVKLFFTNFEEINFSAAFDNYKNIESAFYYSLLGLICFSTGIHLIIRRYNLGKQNFKDLALAYNVRKLVPIYLIVAILYPVINRYSYNFGVGLQQPITKLADFKWMIFFIFMLSSLYYKQWKIFSIIAVFEIVISLTGFFSNFKDYFLVIFAGIIVIYGKNLKAKQMIPLAAIGISCVYMIIVWQYVKPSYRKFLTDGEVTQKVNRTTEESLNKLGELVGKINRNSIDEGFKMTVDRLSYIDYFSASIDYVPRVVPHADGALWGDAIGRVLQPRILFPGKTSIDDSQTTGKYTGIQVAGADRGTSISLGYMAENFVDFGIPWMFISLFGYGLLIGVIYKYVMVSTPDLLIGTGAIIPLFLIIYSFESALNKIVGASIMYLIIFELFRRFGLKWFLKQVKYN